MSFRFYIIDIKQTLSLIGQASSTGDLPLNTTDFMDSFLSSVAVVVLALEDFDFLLSFFGAGVTA